MSSERAEQRRRTWSGGVAQSFEELEQLDLETWLRQTPARASGRPQDLADVMLLERVVQQE